MTETLVFVFEAPNGIGNDPQTVVYKESINADSNGAYQEVVSLADEYGHHCGLFQIDAVTEESANANGGPTMWGQWQALNVGNVAGDLTGVLTTNNQAVGIGYGTECVTVPPVDIMPAVEQDNTPALPTILVDSPTSLLVPAPVPVVPEAPTALSPAPQVATGTTGAPVGVEAVSVSLAAVPADGPALAVTGAHGSSIALLVLIAVLLISSGVIAVRKTAAFIAR